ncbi:MAG: hypothetical protein AAF551_00755 [Bacteroidota bacterium]
MKTSLPKKHKQQLDLKDINRVNTDSIARIEDNRPSTLYQRQLKEAMDIQVPSGVFPFQRKKQKNDSVENCEGEVPGRFHTGYLFQFKKEKEEKSEQEESSEQTNEVEKPNRLLKYLKKTPSALEQDIRFLSEEFEELERQKNITDESIIRRTEGLKNFSSSYYRRIVSKKSKELLGKVKGVKANSDTVQGGEKPIGAYEQIRNQKKLYQEELAEEKVKQVNLNKDHKNRRDSLIRADFTLDLKKHRHLLSDKRSSRLRYYRINTSALDFNQFEVIFRDAMDNEWSSGAAHRIYNAQLQSMGEGEHDATIVIKGIYNNSKRNRLHLKIFENGRVIFGLEGG